MKKLLVISLFVIGILMLLFSPQIRIFMMKFVYLGNNGVFTASEMSVLFDSYIKSIQYIGIIVSISGLLLLNSYEKANRIKKD